ncbi:MAG: hypothetical protein B6D56_08490 [Candidatus Omnitrophica bacterium 4484_70.1]|nr:MAG: hypothetical protein B6D56_08490 [Candidatus Omnitrophica bacterium 4484_70.1]
MIKNQKLLKKFETKLISSQKLSYEENLKIFESMWNFACELKIFPLENPMEGIEKDIELARILNLCSKKL